MLAAHSNEAGEQIVAPTIFDGEEFESRLQRLDRLTPDASLALIRPAATAKADTVKSFS